MGHHTGGQRLEVRIEETRDLRVSTIPTAGFGCLIAGVAQQVEQVTCNH